MVPFMVTIPPTAHINKHPDNTTDVGKGHRSAAQGLHSWRSTHELSHIEIYQLWITKPENEVTTIDLHYPSSAETAVEVSY